MAKLKSEIARELRQVDKILTQMHKANLKEFYLGEKARKKVRKLDVLTRK